MSSWLTQKCCFALTLLGLLALPLGVFAMPGNDDCATAQNVTLGDIYNVDNTTAANEPFDVGACNLASQTSMRAGVWFRYDSIFTGVLRVEEASTQNIAAGIWEMDTVGATCPAGGPSTFCAATDTFHINVQSGKTYYFLVFSDTATAPTVPMVIVFYQVVPPANDQCADAQVIDLETEYVVDNTTAGDDLHNIGCATTSRGVGTCGVWFKYDCTLTGLLKVSESTPQNTAVGIWEMDTGSAACPAPGTSPTFCHTTTGFNVPITSGKTYYFLVQNNAATVPTVPMNIIFYYVTPPANDDCSDALVISSMPARFQVDNSGANHDIDGGFCDVAAGSNYGVWFRYDSGSEPGVMLIEEFSTQTVAVGVWASGSCPESATATFCGFYGFLGIQRFGFPTLANTTYFINVHVDSATSSPPTPMDVKFSLLPSVGDDCATATPISGTGVFTFHNVRATAPVAPFTSLRCGADPFFATSPMALDSWYKWVAPVSGKASIMNRSFPVALGSRLAIFPESAPGVCPTSASSLVRCVNMGQITPISGIPDGAAATNGIDTWNVVAGTTYYFQFASRQAQSSNNGDYGFAEMELLVEPSANGRCCTQDGCLLTSQQDCAARGGAYGGDGSVCVSHNSTTSSYAGGSIAMFGNNQIGNSFVPYTSGSVTIADTFTVEDVEVEVDIGHSSQGDVRLALVKDGMYVPLTHRGRYGFSPAGNAGLDLAGVYTFNDAGATTLFDAANLGVDPIPAGVYRPAGSANVNNGLRANFHGKSAAGVWTLVATGDAASGGGAVNSWTLRLKQGGNISCCPADFNGVNGVTVQDIFDFLTAWLAGNASADFNGVNGVTVQDIFDFLTAWLAGC